MCKELEHFLESLDYSLVDLGFICPGFWPVGHCTHVPPAGEGIRLGSTERCTIHRRLDSCPGV